MFLPRESPWTEEAGGLQSMGSQRVRHDWETKDSTAYQYGLYHSFLPNVSFIQWQLTLAWHCCRENIDATETDKRYKSIFSFENLLLNIYQHTTALTHVDISWLQMSRQTHVRTYLHSCIVGQTQKVWILAQFLITLSKNSLLFLGFLFCENGILIL